jgi:hypothetical protein
MSPKIVKTNNFDKNFNCFVIETTIYTHCL